MEIYLKDNNFNDDEIKLLLKSLNECAEDEGIEERVECNYIEFRDKILPKFNIMGDKITIVFNKECKMVGYFFLNCFDYIDKNSYKLSYGTLREFRGQGYATKIIEKIKEMAIDNNKTIIAKVYKDNEISRHLLEDKSGFRPISYNKNVLDIEKDDKSYWTFAFN